GDGKSDVLWRNTQTGLNVYWKMGPSGKQALVRLPKVRGPWTVAK
ncbi:VCBS repeat-containing protein, partial [Candidatus Parcubacteria bacterium]